MDLERLAIAIENVAKAIQSIKEIKIKNNEQEKEKITPCQDKIPKRTLAGRVNITVIGITKVKIFLNQAI